MEFDFSRMAPRDAYRLMTNVVCPRPIALVTTISRTGIVNAAPFAFFNAISYDPCMVVLGIEPDADGGHKDTGQNIRDTNEFVVHIVDEPLAERMNVCSVDFQPEVDELAEAGLTAVPSLQVKPPRIAEAPVALECRRHVTLELGRLRQIVVGEVVHVGVREGIVDPATLLADPGTLNAVGRAGGAWYVRMHDRFEMPRLTLEQYAAMKG